MLRAKEVAQTLHQQMIQRKRVGVIRGQGWVDQVMRCEPVQWRMQQWQLLYSLEVPEIRLFHPVLFNRLGSK